MLDTSKQQQTDDRFKNKYIDTKPSSVISYWSRSRNASAISTGNPNPRRNNYQTEGIKNMRKKKYIVSNKTVQNNEKAI